MACLECSKAPLCLLVIIRDCCSLLGNYIKHTCSSRLKKKIHTLLSQIDVFHGVGAIIIQALQLCWSSELAHNNLICSLEIDPYNPTSGCVCVHVCILFKSHAAKMAVTCVLKGQLDKGRYHTGTKKTFLPSYILVLNPHSNEMYILRIKMVGVCVCTHL